MRIGEHGVLLKGQDGTTTGRLENTGLKILSSRKKEGFMTLLTIAIGQFDIKINSVVNSRDGWKKLKFHGRKYKSPLGNKDRKN